MADGNIKMGVRRAALLNDDDVLKYDKMIEGELAPYLPPPQLPQAQPATPAAPAEPAASPKIDLPPAEPPKPSEADALVGYKDQLRQAQAQAAKNMLPIRTGQAAQSLIDSVSGQKNGAFFEGLAKDAQQPVEGVHQQFDMDKTLAGLRAKDELDNPGSAANRTAQQAFASTYPELAKQMGPSLARQTAKSLETWTKAGEKKDTLGVLKDWHHTQDENTDAERARKSNNDAVNAIINQYKAGSGRISAMKLPPDPLNRAGPVDDRFDLTRLEKMGKETSKFANFAQAFKTLDELVPGFSRGQSPADYPLDLKQRLLQKDPTGFAQNFSDPRAQQIHHALDELSDLIGRDRSGAVLNNAEIARYQKMLQDGLAAGGAQTALAVSAVRQAIGHKLQALQIAGTRKAPNSSASPFEMWSNGGGLTFNDLLDENEMSPGAGRAPPAESAPPQPAPPATPPQGGPAIKTDTPVKEGRKAYSKSQNKTYIFDSKNEQVGVEDGDTRGR